MKAYTVHLALRPGGAAEPVVIRDGFNAWAALLGIVWALANRLWLVALLLALAQGALSLALDAIALHAASETAVWVAFAVLVGAHANDWRRATIERRGYRLAEVVLAPNSDIALARYYGEVAR